MEDGFQTILWVLLVTTAITDLLWGKIFNWITLPAILLGIFLRFFLYGSESAFTALQAITLAFVLFFPLYLIKALAAGDVKLLMSIAAWSVPLQIWKLGATSIVIAGLVGIYDLSRRQGFQNSINKVASSLSSGNIVEQNRMPFAPAFLCGWLILSISEMHGWQIF